MNKGSETKHPFFLWRGEMDCFASLAMTLNSRYDPAFPRRDAPEFFTKTVQPRKTEGAGNAGCPMPPAAPRVRNKTKHTSVVTTAHRNKPGIPRAMVLLPYFALSPVTRLGLTPSPALLIADLTPASGRQNDTTWPYASASFVRLAFARAWTLPRPPHPLPTSVTIAKRPPPFVGTGRRKS